MKIAVFASQFYPHSGGVEEVVRQSAHALRARGHDVIVLTNRFPKDLPRFQLFEGIPVHRLRFIGPDSDDGGLRGFKTRVKFAWKQPRTEMKVAAIIEAHGSEILHVHCVSNNAFYALQERDRAPKPLIISAHGERTMDAGGIYERSEFLNATLRRALQRADWISACSRHTLEDLHRYSGARFENRAQVLYSGVRVADFADAVPYSHPRPYGFAMGRMVPQKGFDVLLEAFARAEMGRFDLILAGDGPQKAALEGLAARLGIAASVHFLGRAERAKVAQLMAGCAFFVLPSRMEPMGIVSLEAMSAGKAVVASRVGGVPEIVIEGETGVLFEPGNAPQLADLLEQMASDARWRQKLGAAGLTRASLFDWERATDQIEAVYLDLLAEQKSSRPGV